MIYDKKIGQINYKFISKREIRYMQDKTGRITDKIIISLFQKDIDVKSNLLCQDDDAVSFFSPPGIQIVNVDTFVDKTDKPLNMPLKACGYKAVISSLSDIIAKGGLPHLIIIAFGLPESIKEAEIISLLEGIKKASRKYNVSYPGGDISKTCDLIISVTSFGVTVNGFPPIPRHAELKEGDELYWIGPSLGNSGAALEILLNNNTTELRKYSETLAEAFFYQELPIDFLKIVHDYREHIISSVDCSDGLIRSLYLLISSEVKINLSSSILKVENWVNEYSGNADHLENLVCYSGEEYGTIFVIRGINDSIREVLLQYNVKLIAVAESGSGEVMFKGRIMPDKGWAHFS